MSWSSVFAQTPLVVLTEVYDDLIQSIGDSRVVTPKLMVVNSSEDVASFDAEGGGTIKFEMQAYIICRSFGKDSLKAMAFILAHELGHVYNNHGWLSKFKSSYASTEFGKDLKKAKVLLDTLVIYESQADEFASYYTAIAGYPTNDLGEEILERIYDGYKFPEKLKKYPSLTARKTIVKNSAAKIEKLIPLYEYSTSQYALGNYHMALIGFEHIATKFPSREMFNNIAVCYANRALQELPIDSIPYVIPFELDWNSRLDTTKERDFTDKGIERANKFLELAETNLENCIHLDKGYAIGYYNRALVNHFLNNFDERDFYLGQGLKKSVNDQERAMYSSCKGIFLLLEGQTEEGIAQLKESVELNGGINEVNMFIALGQTISTDSDPQQIDIQMVDEVVLSKYLGVNNKKLFDFKLGRGAYELKISELPGSNVIVGKLTKQKLVYRKLQYINASDIDGYNELDMESIYARFGEPSNVSHVGNKLFLIYRDANILFELKEQQLVRIIKFFDVS
jgi:tetratricopeptide (TPR) repeat protein